MAIDLERLNRHFEQLAAALAEAGNQLLGQGGNDPALVAKTKGAGEALLAASSEVANVREELGNILRSTSE